jgi:hypothetical protein
MKGNEMKKFGIIAAVVAMGIGLSACGEMVEVPPAHAGKIMTKEGLQPEVYPPSKFRLPVCVAFCDKLYVVETSDKSYQETFSVFMPKDQLNMSFDVRLNGSIPSDSRLISSILDRIPVESSFNESSYHGVVTAIRVYETYAQPVVRSVIRDIMTQYTIDEVASNRESINAEMQAALTAALANIPFRANTAQLADVQFPDVIVTAKEAAKEREIAIQRQEADNQIRFRKLKADLEAAKQQRAIDREKAEAVREQNEIYAQSVTDKFIEWRKLEVLESLAASGATVFVPYSSLDEVGISNRMLNRQ